VEPVSKNQHLMGDNPWTNLAYGKEPWE
jgi:hypothetical protein